MIPATETSRRRTVLLLLVAGILVSVQRAETHKPITSRYTYNEDVFPILRDRCGRCHVRDGIAPMSLMTYREAFPWGESIRAEMIAGHMPPWHAREGAAGFRNEPTMTAADIDKILVWVSGGYPEGKATTVVPPVVLHHDWPLGAPDLVVPLTETTLDADTSEIVRVFTVRTGTTEPRWLRAVDLLPGTPSVVRDAIVSITNSTPSTAKQIAAADVLASWLPGEDPVEAKDGAFLLPANAELSVRIHYTKTYSYRTRQMTDRSSVGLYFADTPSREIQRFTLVSAPVETAALPISFSRTLDRDLEVLAVTPDPSLSNARIRVDAVDAAGVRSPIIDLTVRPHWTRRYWFDQPLTLRRGTRIEVLAVLNGSEGPLLPGGTPLPPQVFDTPTPLSVTLDVLSH